MWHIKYRPKDLDGFIGKKSAKDAGEWDGKTPLLIHGACGTGKTLLAGLLASSRGWDIVWVGSDNMDRALEMSCTMGLFGGEKALILDDIDTFRDIRSVAGLIKESKSPVILTAGDISDRRLANVKRLTKHIGLRRPLPSSIAGMLAKILDSEGIGYDREALISIAKGCQGDVRAAILDLQQVAQGKAYISEGGWDASALIRDRTHDIYRALSVIFGGRDIEKVIKSTWDISEQPRDILWWVSENAPRLYKDPKALKGCYKNLSRADIFLGRIMRRQYWGFLRYANALMTAGVNSERPQRINFTQYRFPGYFASLGRTKAQRNMETDIAKKIGPPLHVSRSVAKSQYIPLFKSLIGAGKADKESIAHEFRLEPDQAAYFSK